MTFTLKKKSIQKHSYYYLFDLWSNIIMIIHVFALLNEFQNTDLSCAGILPQLLCILTSKWVLRMPFAGQNRLSDA